MMKAVVLDLIEKSGSYLQSMIESLTDEERSKSGSYEKWSIKDQIGHIEAWKEQLSKNLMAVMQGRSPSRSEDYEQSNRDIFERFHDRPLEEIVDWAHEVEARFLESVRALSEEDLMRRDYFPWQDGREFWRVIIGNSFMHPVSHLAQAHIERGETQQATAMQEEAYQLLSPLDQSGGWQGVLIYNLACHYSLCGDKTKAIECLSQAFQLSPELVDWSKQDPDLDPIRNEPGFLALYSS